MENTKTLNDIFEGLDPYYAHLFTDKIVAFTKHHVQSALKAASEKGEIKGGGFRSDSRHLPSDPARVCTSSILNAYPLTNIK